MGTSMFTAKFSETRFFKGLLSSLVTVIDEAIFSIEDKGISLRAINPSRVAIVHVFIPTSAFEAYSYEKDERMCFSIEYILKLLKETRSEEPISFSYDEERGQIEIKVMGEYEKYFVIPSLGITSEEEVSLPQISSKTKFRITNECLKKILEEISTVSEEVTIESHDNTIIFKGIGDLGTANLTLTEKSEPLLNLEVIESSKATYGVGLLSEIVKASSIGTDIARVEFSKDSLLKLDFALPYEGILEYYLAPFTI